MNPGAPGANRCLVRRDAARIRWTWRESGWTWRQSGWAWRDPGRAWRESGYTAARNAAIAKAVAGIAAPSHGVTVDQLSIVITNPNHPLAAGLSGRVQVYRVPREMNWGAHLAPGHRWLQRLRLPSMLPVMPPPTLQPTTLERQ